jgi:hypothetical protein
VVYNKNRIIFCLGGGIMVTVIDVLTLLRDKYGRNLVITLEGDIGNIRKGSILTDCMDKTIKVLEVAIVEYINPKDFGKKLDVMVEDCDVKVGDEFIVL